MYRKFTPALAALIILTGTLAFAARPTAAQSVGKETLTFDFQRTLNPWLANSPSDNCVTDKTLRRQTEDRFGPLPGNSYAALASSPGCRIWMVAKFEISGTEFDISYDARSVGGCDGCLPLLYAGRSLPGRLFDFVSDQSSMDGSWEHHQHRIKVSDIDGIPSETIFVALSYVELDGSATDPPIYQHVGFDNITIGKAMLND